MVRAVLLRIGISTGTPASIRCPCSGLRQGMLGGARQHGRFHDYHAGGPAPARPVIPQPRFPGKLRRWPTPANMNTVWQEISQGVFQPRALMAAISERRRRGGAHYSPRHYLRTPYGPKALPLPSCRRIRSGSALRWWPSFRPPVPGCGLADAEDARAVGGGDCFFLARRVSPWGRAYRRSVYGPARLPFRGSARFRQTLPLS